MKSTARILLSTALAILLAVPSTMSAQRRATGNSTRSTATQRSAAPASGQVSKTSKTPATVSSNRQIKNAVPSQKVNTPTQVRPSNNSSRPVQNINAGKVNSGSSSTQNRPAINARPNGSNGGNTRPGTSPGSNDNRPGTSPGVQPGGNNDNRPGGGVRPGGNDNKPDNGGNRPGGNDNRPGNGDNRPGGNGINNRPGGHGPGGNSAQRPGTAYRPTTVRPNYNYMRPDYRPPRPGGGFIAPPPVNAYRPVYFLPPPPPRPVVFRPGIPTIGTILGLTFGTFIDNAIYSLYNTGYNVLGYSNNMVYLGNVNQLGYLWPEATIYYTDGLLSNTQFQYWTPLPDLARFNNVYRQLVATYGAPVSNSTYNGVTTVSWWGGNNTGFITLQYGPGTSATGLSNYYTTLTYSDNY